MNKIIFYNKLSEIKEHFSVGYYSELQAKNRITELNKQAEAAGLKISADVVLLKKVHALVNNQIHDIEDMNLDYDDYDDDDDD